MLTDARQPEQQERSLAIDGKPLSLDSYARAVDGRVTLSIADEPELRQRVRDSRAHVDRAIGAGLNIYGVTTGFGGMADKLVPGELAAGLQNNLLTFLAAGAGTPVDARHVRGAMLLRANVLLRGCSGVRMELVDRLVRFLNADAVPVVRELGSIGASGDLIPLATIARAITGEAGMVRVQRGQRQLDATAMLAELGLKPLSLLPKEGLALVNGTSFSAAIAANATREATRLMALSVVVQSMLLRALQVQQDPFHPFVHECKPHPGQVWTARIMKQLLEEGCKVDCHSNGQVQDRYSLRCLPQYTGPVVEGMARIQQVVLTEMNGVSDNPLIDPDEGQFFQGGNFLGQYVALAMDDLRRFCGLLAKHLDVQIAMLVAPEFSGGLTSSLRGNDDLAFNMGLKGLQICGNSIMPLLTWYGNPLCERFPTHAEQFNQNINGLSWGAANLAWKSVELFQQYAALSLIFAVQSLDLRARSLWGHCDGRELLGRLNEPLYTATCQLLQREPSRQRPLLFDDADRWLEEDISALARDLSEGVTLVSAVRPVLDSFAEHFGIEA
jgi:phenylalanine ammonia-lyase